jgi:hypothetical protein
MADIEMKKYVAIRSYDYPSDVEKIQEQLATLGIEVSKEDAYEAWLGYSDNMAAGFMCVPEDPENTWYNISPYLMEVDDG